MNLEEELSAVMRLSAPALAKAIRELRDTGVEKSIIVERVTRCTAKAPFTRNAMFILIDAIWKETK